MDINEALAALRGAFPRVGWVLDDEFGYIFAAGARNRVIVWVMHMEDGAWSAEGGKLPHVKAPNPVSAVRAWLAAQPTAAFYPEVQGGETVQIKGWVAFNDANDYTFAPDGGAGNEWESRQDAIDGLLHHGDPIVHAFTLRVPVPVEPPVLVGEVET